VVESDYNIAYLHYLRGEYTRALELYQAARERARVLGDAYHSALCDLDQSELYLELNLLEEGIALAEQAFAGFDALHMRYEAALADLVLARVELAVGHLVSARARCQAAIARLQEASAPDLSHRAHFLLGQVEEALGARPAALEAYEAARQRLENLRSHLEQD